MFISTYFQEDFYMIMKIKLYMESLMFQNQ
jgi:hypothetical protein